MHEYDTKEHGYDAIEGRWTRAATKNILIYIIFQFHKSFQFFNLKSFSIVSK